MSSTRKVLFAIGCLGPLPIATALLLAAAYSDFDGGAGGWLGPTLIAIYYVMVGSMVVTLIAVVVHIARRHDLSSQQRTRWLVGAFFFNVFLLPFAWWKLIRPLSVP